MNKEFVLGWIAGVIFMKLVVPWCRMTLSRYRLHAARKKAASPEVQSAIRRTAEEFFPLMTEYQVVISDDKLDNECHVAISFESNESVNKVANSDFLNEVRRRVGKSMDFCHIMVW